MATTTKDSRAAADVEAAQAAAAKDQAEKAEQQRRADAAAAERAAADPEQKFRDGEYEVLQPIEHDQVRYEPAAPGQPPVKVKVTAKQAQALAAVGAIKV